MRPLLVVSDHPSLNRGFATVGHNISHGLQQSGRWQVEYFGRYPGRPGGEGFSYRVHDLHLGGQSAVAEGDPRLGSLLSIALRRLDGRPLDLLVIGTAADVECLLFEVERNNLRERLRIAAYIPVDFAPLPVQFSEIVERVDVLIPFSPFAKSVTETCCAEAGISSRRVTAPIPHGVDVETFRPLDCEQRVRVRRDFFGLTEKGLLIGYFGRNSGHKRPDLAVRVFHHFAAGTYVCCRRCRHPTVFVPSPIDLSSQRTQSCRHCSSQDLAAGVPHPGARLYLHTELLSAAERHQSGGWDIDLLVRRLGIADQVQLDPSLEIGRGVAQEELVERMGACDLHLLPYDCGGWELTVLETGACGIPNVITDYAAPPEYAHTFAELIPVNTHVIDAQGIRGIMDIDLALEAVLRLSASPERRRALGVRGVEAGRAYAWDRVVESWDRLLRRLCDL